MAKRTSRTNLSEFDVGGNQVDELFDVLSDSRRRAVFRSLQAAETPVSVEKLTTDLLAWETRRPAPDRPGDGRDAIGISLVHNHLPKMAEAELVRYDDTRGTVALADRTDEVRAHLQSIASD